jgi:transposase
LQREYARAARGKIVEGLKRGTRFGRVNAIGALCQKKHFAIECYKHTTNSAFFESWFKDSLLKAAPKGYTVIMDNAAFHRKNMLRKLARGKARLLFLPPYSPDCNMIEKSWANMKRCIRNNKQCFSSIEHNIYHYFKILI